MPFRIDPDNPRVVQVKKDGKWTFKGRSKTAAKAKEYLKACWANIGPSEKAELMKTWNGE